MEQSTSVTSVTDSQVADILLTISHEMCCCTAERLRHSTASAYKGYALLGCITHRAGYTVGSKQLTDCAQHAEHDLQRQGLAAECMLCGHELAHPYTLLRDEYSYW